MAFLPQRDRSPARASAPRSGPADAAGAPLCCPWRSSSGAPLTVCLDPLGAVRRGRRQRKIENGNRLAATPARADGDNLFASVQVDAFDDNRDSKHCRLERHRQVLVDHREPACDLLRLVVGVDRRLLDHLLEPRLAEAGKLPVLAPHRLHVKSSVSIGDRGISSRYSTTSWSLACTYPIRSTYDTPTMRAPFRKRSGNRDARPGAAWPPGGGPCFQDHSGYITGYN